jgi:hypothetical protein
MYLRETSPPKVASQAPADFFHRSSWWDAVGCTTRLANFTGARPHQEAGWLSGLCAEPRRPRQVIIGAEHSGMRRLLVIHSPRQNLRTRLRVDTPRIAKDQTLSPTRGRPPDVGSRSLPDS